MLWLGGRFKKIFYNFKSCRNPNTIFSGRVQKTAVLVKKSLMKCSNMLVLTRKRLFLLENWLLFSWNVKFRNFTSNSFSFWVLSSKRFIYVVFHAYLWCSNASEKDQYEAQFQIFQILWKFLQFLNGSKIQIWLEIDATKDFQGFQSVTYPYNLIFCMILNSRMYP